MVLCVLFEGYAEAQRLVPGQPLTTSTATRAGMPTRCWNDMELRGNKQGDLENWGRGGKQGREIHLVDGAGPLPQILHGSCLDKAPHFRLPRREGGLTPR